MGGSFKDNLGSSIVSTGIATGGAIAAGKIGDFTLFDEKRVPWPLARMKWLSIIWRRGFCQKALIEILKPIRQVSAS
ncbi:hypothetical protein [Pseudomonas sp. ICMP 10191]|uniref:hypothetical protein n=1 Tax=Pseudomonas sp. ICMP 10191 TaxID=1198294 RepID=UPI0022A9D049|nr:hypothetical protein [Pseudomonas sp. ICMP 10191]